MSKASSSLDCSLATEGKEEVIKAMKRVLSIGQCAADDFALSRAIRRHFDAEVIAAQTAAEALDKLRENSFALVLVNRVFDADDTSGIEFIKELKIEENLRQVPVMLVSNHQDAQREAVEAGAVPGFGKGALGQPPMLARLDPFLEARHPA